MLLGIGFLSISSFNAFTKEIKNDSDLLCVSIISTYDIQWVPLNGITLGHSQTDYISRIKRIPLNLLQARYKVYGHPK